MQASHIRDSFSGFLHVFSIIPGKSVTSNRVAAVPCWVMARHQTWLPIHYSCGSMIWVSDYEARRALAMNAIMALTGDCSTTERSKEWFKSYPSGGCDIYPLKKCSDCALRMFVGRLLQNKSAWDWSDWCGCVLSFWGRVELGRKKQLLYSLCGQFFVLR